MFHAEPWAAAFINVLGSNAEAGLACLKALTPPVKSVSGALFGRQAAQRLEKIVLECINDCGCADDTARYAVRFICLLVEKNIFRRIDLIIAGIEKRIDTQKGILEVTAESAAAVDSAFEEELKKMICRRTGAAGIKMKVQLVPELLAGYRLRIGGSYIDASLRGQLENMAADLAEEY